MNYRDLDTSKLNYIIYCRKSSEGEDKQIQSLETQLRELKEHAGRNQLKIVEVIQESKSAFKIGREGFNRMMTLVRTGKANAILVVRANRISRNPIDAGYVISLMDEKKLLYVRTPNSTCYTCSSSDKMMIALELIMSKKDSDDKGDMVKEGQKTKALKGYPHGVAAIGFLNDKTEERGNRKWIVDDERLNKVEILLKMFLTGNYSAGKLYWYAVNELHLTTPKHKKQGGHLIVLSRIYQILKDPIYAGFFYYGGKRYELNKSLPRLITEHEYDKIQNLISGRYIPAIQKNTATYSGYIKSPEGYLMGQDMKFQVICDCKKKFCYRNRDVCPVCGSKVEKLKDPLFLVFTYYYSVRKKKAKISYKSIPESEVEKQMIKYASENLQFSPELVEWSKKYITELKDKEINQSIFFEQERVKEKDEYEKKKARLREMLRDEQISEKEYRDDLKSLEARYTAVAEKHSNIDWYAKMNEIADLTLSAAYVLENGTLEAKRNILSRMGSNLTWDEENLDISSRKSINKLVEGVKRAKEILPGFEPKNCLAITGLNEKTDRFQPVFSTMLRG